MLSVNKPYKTKGNRTTFQTGIDTNVQYFSIREISLFSTPRTSSGETLPLLQLPARGQRILQLTGLHPMCSPAFNSTPNSQSKKGKYKVEKAANTNQNYLHQQEFKVPVNDDQGHFSVKHHAAQAARQHSSTRPITDTNPLAVWGEKGQNTTNPLNKAEEKGHCILTQLGEYQAWSKVQTPACTSQRCQGAVQFSDTCEIWPCNQVLV